MARITPVNRIVLPAITVSGADSATISGSGAISLGALVAAASGSVSNGASPFIVATDFTAGPVAASGVGENDLGCFLTIYGMNLGTFGDYGTSNFVTIGGVNVNNYRCLENVKGSPYAALGIQRLTVQVGALSGLSAGTAYPVSVTVGGVGPSNPTNGSNYVAPVSGDDITFTPQPGAIYWYDFTNGSDGNSGTFSSPWKNLQNSSGTTYGFKIHPGASTSGGVKPGTHHYMRAGTYTGTGVNSRAIDFFRITGTAPTGATDRGPICLSAYPGAAGANSPETVTISGSNLNGNDSTRATETSTLYGGFTGWCQYLQFSNFKVAVDASLGSDHGPFNTQNHSQYMRIVNCEMTWPSTLTSPQGRSGGIEGSPVNGRFLLNYIHDIYGAGSEANTQHGIYMDGFGSGTGNVAHDNVFAFNYIKDITFGNGIQFFDGVNGGGMRNNTFAHNWIDTVKKHGINIADNTESVDCYNNVVLHAGEDSCRISTSAVAASNGITVQNNTFYGFGEQVSSRYALRSESVPGAGSNSILIRNNIFCQSASHSANSYSFQTTNTGVVFDDNLWYDPDGRLTTKPSGDTAGAYGNPLFTSAGTDFTLADSSPGIDTGTTPANITRSYGFELNTAPDGTVDRGAYERTT